ncbi:unnamed protein product [Toxocara canis]|uniref:Prolactin-induced protein n=1 Tax=Toxocara canis TaxID=6265 RepID=A0A183VB63_TOXCA|nr:unnamed protein product [Toxocara canis]
MLQLNNQKGEEIYCTDHRDECQERLFANMPDFGTTITLAIGGHRCPFGSVYTAAYSLIQSSQLLQTIQVTFREGKGIDEQETVRQAASFLLFAHPKDCIHRYRNTLACQYG